MCISNDIHILMIIVNPKYDPKLDNLQVFLCCVVLNPILRWTMIE